MTRMVRVALPDDLAAEVAAAVSRGEYASEGDAVLGAVSEWQAKRVADSCGLEELKRLVQDGIDSGPGEFETFEEIRAEARRRFDARY